MSAAHRASQRTSRLAALEEFSGRLGLEPETAPGGVLRRYNWPASRNGTRYDRTVLIIEFSDGSWSEYLSTNKLSIAETEVNLRRMVQSTDNKTG